MYSGSSRIVQCHGNATNVTVDASQYAVEKSGAQIRPRFISLKAARNCSPNLRCFPDRDRLVWFSHCSYGCQHSTLATEFLASFPLLSLPQSPDNSHPPLQLHHQSFFKIIALEYCWMNLTL